MKIFIINTHWHNRGDEAAIRALIDELVERIPNVEIVVHFWVVNKIYNFPYDGKKVRYICEPERVSSTPNQLLEFIHHDQNHEFVKELITSDLVLYAPGGAIISDHQIRTELNYLAKLLLAKKYKKPYIFYAPSMGPFHIKWRNMLRKYVLNKSALLCVREPITARYLKELGINKKVNVTLDSAFQHEVDRAENQNKLSSDIELNSFLHKYEKIVGITITNLMWSTIYSNDKKLPERIKNTFRSFIDELDARGYGVVFIPQLFGEQNDYRYMRSFLKENCYIINNNYDCYFQQFLISKLYCVVGMRYHSNIFSAKMGTPFISISYQEKMTGFMQKTKLDNYCIDVRDLSYNELISRFDFLCNNYSNYKEYLNKIRPQLIKESRYTTDLICDYIKNNIPNTDCNINRTNSNTFYDIEKKGNCVKCGICSSVCKQHALQMSYNEKEGFFDLSLKKDRCNHCGMCLKVCPVNNNFNKTSQNMIGDYRNILLGHSLHIETRKNATSGGCVNAFVRYLILEDKIDAVLMTCEDNSKKNGTGFIIINRDNIYLLDETPRKFASRYVSYPILAALKRLEKIDRIAMVGTPCQIHALSNYSAIAKKKKIFKIGIACSGGISYKATEYIKNKTKSSNGTVYYRGNGWPGQFQILDNNKSIGSDYLKSFFSVLYTSQIFRNPACLQCNDQFAEVSDISFFDYWNEKELVKERIGNSGIIVRTQIAEDYLNDMLQKNYIKIQENLSEKNVLESQEWPIKIKKNEVYRKPLVSMYYKLAQFIFKSKLYKFIPEKGFMLLSKLFLKLISIT